MIRAGTILLLLSILCIGNAFLVPAPQSVQTRCREQQCMHKSVLMAQRDKSRSGTKRERLNRLAELEESRVETDKSLVGLAAGGFVGLLVLLLVVAFASGIMDPIMNTGY
jgi:hypothetical protein